MRPLHRDNTMARNDDAEGISAKRRPYCTSGIRSTDRFCKVTVRGRLAELHFGSGVPHALLKIGSRTRKREVVKPLPRPRKVLLELLGTRFQLLGTVGIRHRVIAKTYATYAARIPAHQEGANRRLHAVHGKGKRHASTIHEKCLSAMACYTRAMFGKTHRAPLRMTLLFLGTTLCVFIIGIMLAPELIPVLAPACMIILAVGYIVFAWMERKTP